MKLIITSVFLFVVTLQAQSEFRFFINNINMPMDNKGVLSDVYRIPGGSLGRYNDIVFLFSGGFWLSGYNDDTLWANAQATASRIANYIPGNVDSNQNDPRYKVYVVNQFNTPFGDEWQQWKFAVNLGADFYDGDSDGIYNPIDLNNNGKWDSDEDKPDIIGYQVAWCVFNDGDTIGYHQRWNPPLGIEIHQTVFGYATSLAPQLKNVLFIRYKIINKGTVNPLLDSVYFTAWADADLGIYFDDSVGCDTLTNSGYTYNSTPDDDFGDKPPAFFINLLQGPYSYIPGETFIDNNANGTYEDSVDIPLDTAYNHQGPLKGIQNFPGAKNQNMTSFIQNTRHVFETREPDSLNHARNFMLGLDRQGISIDPCSLIYGSVLGGISCSEVNPAFMYSGDPANEIGWINSLTDDQRILVNTGPFSLEVDKPITIIVGYTIGQGDSPLNSVTVGKEVSAFVQQFYQSNFDDNVLPVEEEKNLIVKEFKLFQNYPNPFNPSTRIQYAVSNRQFVSLKVYDVLGTEIAILVNEEKPAGTYEVEYNASNLPSGVYFYQLNAGSFIETKKMILLR